MIDDHYTFVVFGNRICDLTRCDKKYVVVCCDVCGTYIRRRFDSYCNAVYPDMCMSCKEYQKYIDNPSVSEHLSIAQKKRFSDAEERKKTSDAKKKYYMSEGARDRQSVAQKKRFEDPEECRKNSAAQNRYWESDDAHVKASLAQKKRYEDPNERIKASEVKKALYKNAPEIGYRQSASKQGQDYDAGEWNGYTNKSRPHILPADACMQMNEPFEGCHRHHILEDVIIHIPMELHRHIKHNIKIGENMREMNTLAVQYVNGWW